MTLPTIEGLLVSRLNGEYTLGVPSLTFAAGGESVSPQGRLIVIPKSRVAFYEVLN